METLASILNWLFINTIFGAAGIAGVVYVILYALKKILPSLPQPAFVAIPVLFIGVVVLPSLPRYQFQNDVLSKIEGRDWIRVVNKTKWGSLTEPLTWVKTPIGSVTILISPWWKWRTSPSEHDR